MRQASETGINRTGARLSPALSEEMIEGAEQGGYSSPSNMHVMEQMRRGDDLVLPPIGSPPPPASLKGMVRTGLEAIKGHRATVLLDKLGERLAFERTGTRLYEALLIKYDSFGSWASGPSREELLQFHGEELAHFHMLCEAVETLGGDPTAMTPSADVAGVASEGVVKVVSDARTTLAESLEALLVAELTDNDGWEMLISLADTFGQDELARRFERALTDEQFHLTSVRRWLMSYNQLDANREIDPETKGLPT